MAEFNFENFLRAYVDFAEANRGWGFNSHRSMFDDVIDSIMKDKYDDEKKVRDREIYFSDFAQGLFDKIYYAKNNHQDMSEMMNIYKFITEQVFYPYQKDDNSFSGYKDKPYDNYGHLSVFMKKLKDMQDKNPDLVYKALGLLKRSVNYKRPGDRDIKEERLPLYHDIVTMMASNPKATVDDVKEMIYWAETPEQMEQIINDVFAMVDKGLTDVMSKDVPDAEKIKKLIVYPNGVIMVAQFQGGVRPSPKYDALITNMKQNDPQKYQAWKEKLNNYDKINNEKYNFDKIFNSGDQQYVAHYESLVETRNVELEQQNGDLKKQNEALTKENSRLTQENTQLRDDKKAAEEKHAAEKKKLEDDLKEANDDLAALRGLIADAQKIVDAYDKGEENISKAGMFKKGEEKVKMMEAIAKAIEVLKKANAAEVERKQRRAQEQLANNRAISM